MQEKGRKSAVNMHFKNQPYINHSFVFHIYEVEDVGHFGVSKGLDYEKHDGIQ